ncbi:MAG: hypothetical protein KC656_27105 [Myxococcales bacterium]|nr:hypothetical protein [Myxococcales bacterium]MCB9669910.1 hypothetical protein [Alphaproteobacteria bacterium]MCB9693216.1 hypothetical protein [Alphaproteobacteria bacterium]
MRYLLPLLVGCALTGPDDLPPATVTFADGRTVDAADCAKGCSGPTPDDLHPLEHDAAIAHLRAWQEQPVGEATEDLETLLFHRKVALEVLDQHGDVLDTAHADFLRAELSRNRVEVAFRLVDDDGVVLGESARTSPLKEKQHIVLEQTGSLKHIVISGKTKRVGLHHLWSRW